MTKFKKNEKAFLVQLSLYHFVQHETQAPNNIKIKKTPLVFTRGDIEFIF